MKLFYVTLTSLLCYSVAGYCQRWKNGVIVLDEGDTLQGQLHCSLRKHAAGEIASLAFRKDKKSTPDVFESPDVPYFKVNGDTYCKVPVFERLEDGRGKEAWAKLLVDGPLVALFEYKGAFYFTYKYKNAFIACGRLIYSSWEEQKGDSITPRANLYYKVQLRKIATRLQVLDRVHGLIDSCPYNHYYLANLFLVMNGGKGELFYQHVEDHWGFSFFIAAGKGFFQDRIYEADLVDGSTRSFNKQRSYFSIGADIRPCDLPIYFRLNMAYSATAAYTGETITDYHNKQTFRFHQNTISGGVSFLYDFHRRPKVNWYGGVSFTYFSALGNRSIPFTSGHLLGQDDILELRKGVMVAGLSGGLRYKGMWEAGFTSVPPIWWVDGGYGSVLKSKGITFFLACHFLQLRKPIKEAWDRSFYRL